MITINTWVLAGILLVMGVVAGTIGYVRGCDIKQERLNVLRLAYKLAEAGYIKSAGDGRIQFIVTSEEPKDEEEEKDE